MPGLVVAWSGGFRGYAAIGLGPLLSAVLIAGTAVVAPWVHLRWGVLPLLLATLAAALLLWGIRAGAARLRPIPWTQRVNRRSVGAVRLESAPRSRATSKAAPSSSGVFRLRVSWATLLGLAASVAVLGWRLTSIFRSPEYVSQTADNVFHLNAVRFILDGGNGSSLSLGAAGGSGPSLYPGGWHDLVALVVQTTGSSIPVAVSAVNLVIGAVLWPLSVIFMARILFGHAKIVDLSAGVLAFCFSAFPYLLIDWGVLYPNYYGMAVLPALLGLGALVAKAPRLRLDFGLSLAVVFTVSCLGLLIVHPNTVLTAGVIIVPLWVARLWGRLRVRGSGVRATRRLRLGALLCLAAVLIVSAVVWIVLRPFPLNRFDITWPPYETPGQALGEFLLTTHSGWLPGYATSVLFIAGLYFAAKRRGSRWLVVAATIWAVLLVSVAGYQTSYFRGLLTGGWYTDFKRIAAGAAVMALIVGVGFVKTATVMTKISLWRHTPLGPGIRRLATSLVAVVALIAVGAVSQTTNVPQAASHAQTNYSLAPGSPIMSADELALYKKIDDIVPAGSTIADNPWDGSAWAYFVSGRQVLFPHVLTPWTPDRGIIARMLNQAADNPLVCTAVRRLNVHYALTSDELIYLPGNPSTYRYPGMAGLELAKGFELVASVGENHLYKITACW
ncbi:DUF6541 family protein [Sinomonas susongensis]|uniref:DUF6541 family protein n=1 Tax=Sinomonas susongensis TaxID=1324851 RepID=UPI00319DEDEF